MGQNGQRRCGIKASKAAAGKKAIIESLEQGASRIAACQAARVGRSTFYTWLDEDETFADQVKRAEVRAVETMESVVYAAGLKAEDDPRFLRAALRWLEQHGGWQRTNVNWNVDLTQCTEQELERIAHGEDPGSVLARTRAGGAVAATAETD